MEAGGFLERLGKFWKDWIALVLVLPLALTTEEGVRGRGEEEEEGVNTLSKLNP